MTTFYHSDLHSHSKEVDSSVCTNAILNRFGISGRKPQEPADEPSVKEFKICVEQVKSEHPHLSVGAINQMALQRFTRHSNSSHKKCHRNNMGKKAFGSNTLSRLLRVNKPDPPGDEASIEKHRSLFRRRRSVFRGQDEDHIEPIERKPTLNIEESLASIELDTSVLCSCDLPPESDHTKPFGTFSENFEVDDFDVVANMCSSNMNIRDTEELDPDAAISKQCLNSKQNRKRPSLKMSSHQVSLSFEDSFSSLDERNFKGDFTAWRRRKSSLSFRSSHRRSSCLSEDETAFKGDFSAWRRASLSYRSPRRRSSCYSEDETNFKGDFSAWRRASLSFRSSRRRGSSFSASS